MTRMCVGDVRETIFSEYVPIERDMLRNQSKAQEGLQKYEKKCYFQEKYSGLKDCNNFVIISRH